MENLGRWVLAITAVILVAELITGRHKNIYSRNDYFVNFICIFIGAAVRPLAAVAVAFLIAKVFPTGNGVLAKAPFIPSLLLIVLFAELANYWAHRLSHEFKGKAYRDWMWRMHRTHHTAKYVNVLLNFRISLFWGFLSGLTWVMSLAIYLGQAKAAGLAIVFFSFWGIFTHSDFRWDDTIRRHRFFGSFFRALEHVFVSPGIHHAHHGYGKDGGNFRNYGIFLSIYDWLFGTLHIPEGRPFRYGIPGNVPHWADDAFAPFNVSHWLKGRNPS